MSVGLGLNIGLGIGLSGPSVTPQGEAATLTLTPKALRQINRLRPVGLTLTPTVSTFRLKDLTGLALDLNGDVGITGSAGTFAWADQSGAGNNASALTGSLGLTTAADSDFNGHTYVVTNGTNDGIIQNTLAASFSGTTKPIYLAMVCKLVTLPANGCLMTLGRSSSANPFDLLKSGAAGTSYTSQRRNDAASLTAQTGGVPDSSQTHVLERAWDATNSLTSLWIDGVAKINALALASGAMTVDRLTFAAGVQNGAPFFFHNLHIARIVLCTTVPDATTRGKVLSLLKATYGTP